MWQTPAIIAYFKRSICVSVATGQPPLTTQSLSFPPLSLSVPFSLIKITMPCSGAKGGGHAPNEHTHLIASAKHQHANHTTTTRSCTNLASKVGNDLTQSSTKKKLAIATTIALLFFATELIAGYLANSLGKERTLWCDVDLIPLKEYNSSSLKQITQPSCLMRSTCCLMYRVSLWH